MNQTEFAIGASHEAFMEPHPFAIPSKKLTMWLFLISDSVTFGACLFAYGYLRIANPDWPTPFAFSPSILNVMLMTFVLITSSLTMLGAAGSAAVGNKRGSVRWIALTMLLGIIFAALHIREWLALISEGVRVFRNPWGSSLFGATFFSLTGLHLLHVVSGVVALGVIAIGFSRGRFDAGHVESAGLYWHFVDVVWMFIVPLVYLLNVLH